MHFLEPAPSYFHLISRISTLIFTRIYLYTSICTSTLVQNMSIFFTTSVHLYRTLYNTLVQYISFFFFPFFLKSLLPWCQDRSTDVPRGRSHSSPPLNDSRVDSNGDTIWSTTTNVKRHVTTHPFVFRQCFRHSPSEPNRFNRRRVEKVPTVYLHVS